MLALISSLITPFRCSPPPSLLPCCQKLLKNGVNRWEDKVGKKKKEREKQSLSSSLLLLPHQALLLDDLEANLCRFEESKRTAGLEKIVHKIVSYAYLFAIRHCAGMCIVQFLSAYHELFDFPSLLFISFSLPPTTQFPPPLVTCCCL